MKAKIDSKQFGPWALITGASSGIGKEFARQIAASGIHVVLAARRQGLLEAVGSELAKDYGVQYRTIVVDLSKEDSLQILSQATHDLDIGLVISNAGTANPGKFITQSRDDSVELLRLNAFAHLEIAHHFGKRLVERRRGGLLLCGAMGAAHGIPLLANVSGAKAYVQSFGESLHIELKPLGVNVTVLIVGPTQTAIIDKFGLKSESMPMKPMCVEQCVFEGLEALRKNKSSHLPGRINQLMTALIPSSMSRRLMGIMMEKALAVRTTSAHG